MQIESQLALATCALKSADESSKTLLSTLESQSDGILTALDLLKNTVNQEKINSDSVLSELKKDMLDMRELIPKVFPSYTSPPKKK